MYLNHVTLGEITLIYKNHMILYLIYLMLFQQTKTIGLNMQVQDIGMIQTWLDFSTFIYILNQTSNMNINIYEIILFNSY